MCVTWLLFAVSATSVASLQQPGAAKVVDFRPVLSAVLERVEARLGKLTPYAIPDGLSEARSPKGQITETVAYSVGALRQIRAAVIRPEDDNELGIRVLNLVAFPDPAISDLCGWALPVFGADLVTLPGGHLVALDLHPMSSEEEHATAVLPALSPVYAGYQQRPTSAEPTDVKVGHALPWGGDLPEAALPFFSPCALWTRLPQDAAGTETLATTVCQKALFDYLDVFLDLCVQASATATAAAADAARVDSSTISVFSDPPAVSSRAASAAQRQQAYSQYRVEKDPARGMLTRFHGADFTERLITEVLFDFDKAFPAQG